MNVLVGIWISFVMAVAPDRLIAFLPFSNSGDFTGNCFIHQVTAFPACSSNRYCCQGGPKGDNMSNRDRASSLRISSKSLLRASRKLSCLTGCVGGIFFIIVVLCLRRAVLYISSIRCEQKFLKAV